LCCWPFRGSKALIIRGPDCWGGCSWARIWEEVALLTHMLQFPKHGTVHMLWQWGLKTMPIMETKKIELNLLLKSNMPQLATIWRLVFSPHCCKHTWQFPG
jgi:hypothetical protein